MTFPWNQSRDPLTAFRFRLELDGLHVGGFSEVSGLSVETEVEAIREGGVNDRNHQLLKGSKQSNIVLKRGLGDSMALWDWYYSVVCGEIRRQNGSILLKDDENNETVVWIFFDALPVKWDGPALNATTNSVAIESLTLIHQGLMRLM